MQLLSIVIILIFLMIVYGFTKDSWNKIEPTNYNRYISGGIMVPILLQMPFLFFLIYKLAAGNFTEIIFYFSFHKFIILAAFSISFLQYRKQMTKLPNFLFYLLLGTLYLHIVWMESFLKLEHSFFNVTVSIIILCSGYLVYLLFLWKQYLTSPKEKKNKKNFITKRTYFNWIVLSCVFSFLMVQIPNSQNFLWLGLLCYQVYLFSLFFKQKLYVIGVISLMGSLLLQYFVFALIHIFDRQSYLYQYMEEYTLYLPKILLYMLLLLFPFILSLKKATMSIRIMASIIVILLFFLISLYFV